MSKSVNVAACVTKKFSHLVKAYVKRSTYQNTSDLIRAILREEIKREAPDLYQKFTRGDATHLKSILSDDNGSKKKGVDNRDDRDLGRE